MWEVIPTLEFLMGILENKAIEYGKDLTEFRQRADPQTLEQMDIDLPDHKHLLICLKNGWDKLDDYYN